MGKCRLSPRDLHTTTLAREAANFHHRGLYRRHGGGRGARRPAGCSLRSVHRPTPNGNHASRRRGNNTRSYIQNLNQPPENLLKVITHIFLSATVKLYFLTNCDSQAGGGSGGARSADTVAQSAAGRRVASIIDFLRTTVREVRNITCSYFHRGYFHASRIFERSV